LISYVFFSLKGILIALNLIHKDKKKNETLGIIIMLVSRKVTIVLYEIGLGCKFFIYQRTLQNFRYISFSSSVPVNNLSSYDALKTV